MTWNTHLGKRVLKGAEVKFYLTLLQEAVEAGREAADTLGFAQETESLIAPASSKGRAVAPVPVLMTWPTAFFGTATGR